MHDRRSDLGKGMGWIHCEGELDEAFPLGRKEGPSAGEPFHDEAGEILPHSAVASRDSRGDEIERLGQPGEHLAGVDVRSAVDDSNRESVDGVLAAADFGGRHFR
jgi:hypothetical protein